MIRRVGAPKPAHCRCLQQVARMSGTEPTTTSRDVMIKPSALIEPLWAETFCEAVAPAALMVGAIFVAAGAVALYRLRLITPDIARAVPRLGLSVAVFAFGFAALVLLVLNSALPLLRASSNPRSRLWRFRSFLALDCYRPARGLEWRTQFRFYLADR